MRGRWWGWGIEEGSGSFLKKRTKKLFLILGCRCGMARIEVEVIITRLEFNKQANIVIASRAGARRGEAEPECDKSETAATMLIGVIVSEVQMYGSGLLRLRSARS
jgi:hypothetical protein